jgi:asparagine synthase (glutamine-hydrolysing)
MCGIAGFISTALDPAAGARALGGMLATILHRGPDGEGRLDRAPFHLGMRRLAIIDLTTGDQPLWSDCGRYAVFMNGEIYNYRELKTELESRGRRFKTKSDTEVVANLFAESGTAGLARLNGMFALAIFDTRDQELLLCRDLFGVKPLYVMERSPAGGPAFASELKALRAMPDYGAALDAAALSEYLALDYVPAPRSIDAGVAKLRPGEWWRVGADGVRAKGFLPLPAPAELEAGVPYPAQIRAVLRAAVKRQLISDRPVGVFLSGGIDSAAIAACVKAAGAQLTAYTVGFSDADFDESALALATAQRLGLPVAHQRLGEADLLAAVNEVYPRLDEPFADPSILPTFLLCRHAAAQVTVALSGDGGDELFGGYPTYGALRMDRQFLRLPKLLRRGLLPALARALPASDGRYGLDYKAGKFLADQDEPPWRRQLSFMGAFDTAGRTAVSGPALPQAGLEFAEKLWKESPVDGLGRNRWFDLFSYLAEGVLQKTDRASMLNSLEVRVPYLDPQLYALAFAIPPQRHHGLRRTKTLLRAAFADELPPAVIRGAKKGFGIPVARWLRQGLRSELVDLLSPDRLRRQGLFNPEAVKRLLDEHLQGKRNHRKALWNLLSFQRFELARSRF